VRADRQKDGLVAALGQGVDGEVAPQGLPGLELDSQTEDRLHLARDHVLGHAEVGQTHLEHAAGHGQGLEDGHGEPREGELIGRS